MISRLILGTLQTSGIGVGIAIGIDKFLLKDDTDSDPEIRSEL